MAEDDHKAVARNQKERQLSHVVVGNSVVEVDDDFLRHCHGLAVGSSRTTDGRHLDKAVEGWKTKLRKDGAIKSQLSFDELKTLLKKFIGDGLVVIRRGRLACTHLDPDVDSRSKKARKRNTLNTPKRSSVPRRNQWHRR